MTILTDQLLNAIWTGQAKPFEPADGRKLCEVLDNLLPFRKIMLAVPDGPLCGRAFGEDAEVLPSLPIGDVLAEEFSIDVPLGTVVICCSEHHLASDCRSIERSNFLGRVCAEVVIDAIHLGKYRIEREPDAVRLLCETFVATARGIDNSGMRISFEAFRSALTRRVAEVLGTPPPDPVPEEALSGTALRVASALQTALPPAIAKPGASGILANDWRDQLEKLILEAEPQLSTFIRASGQKSASPKV